MMGIFLSYEAFVYYSQMTLLFFPIQQKYNNTTTSTFTYTKF